MKKIFTLIACALMTIGAMAEDTVLTPSAEYQFRTNGQSDPANTADPTGWTKNVNGADVASIECTYSARMWGQEQFDVTGIDFSKVTSVTVSFTMAGSANYRLGAWVYPNADWTEASEQAWTEGKCPIVENFKQIFGQYPGYVGTSNNYVVRYEGTASPAVQDLVFTGTALDAIKNGIVEKEGKKYINLIITFSEPKAGYSTGRNPKYYSIQDPTKQPKMTIASEAIVGTIVNDATGTAYDDLASAVASVEAGATASFTINKDVTITSRVNVQDRDITFKGATGAEKILRGTGYKGLLFLTVKPSTDMASTLTVENVIIDGQNVECTGSTIESSNNGTMTYRNVTFQNCINTTGTQGVFCNKSGGVAVLDGVTLKDCSAPASKAPVFVGTNNVTLAGANSISAIHIEKANSIKDGGVTGTQALVVDATRAANLLLVSGGKVENYTVSGQAEGLSLVQDEMGVILADSTYTAINDALRYDNDALRYDNALRFNLLGQRVAKNMKGIAIINGKKVVMK